MMVSRIAKDQFYDVVVVGGGVAGFCAAVAAARMGSRVALVNDRPVLGGNSSSEVRVWAIGASCTGYFRNARETGITEEVQLEAAYRSEGVLPILAEPYPMWDIVLKEWCDREPNLDLYLNTRAYEVSTHDNRLESITALQTSTEKSFRFFAKYFIESSGDGEIGAKAGASWRYGQESRAEFGENLAPGEPNRTVLPSSIMFSTRDVGHPVHFYPPEWAYKYASDDDLPWRNHKYIKSGYWWVSTGGTQDMLNDTEEIRDELHKILFGVWDHVKNHGDHGASSLVLDWVGQVVGKRESRRFEGDYMILQDDVLYGRHFSDAVAFGGWPVDLHPSTGIFSRDEPTEQIEPEKPYSIPFRALYSRNIENLFLNGRLLSASHVAMGSIRVQKTLGVVGQAIGTAAAMCVRLNKTPREFAKECMPALQQELLKQDCYIPHIRNADPQDLARLAHITASSNMQLPTVAPNGKHELYTRRAQKFVISDTRIDRIFARLVSERDEPVMVTAHLHRAPELWDFSTQEILTTCTVELASHYDNWVAFEFNYLGAEPSQAYWIELEPLYGVSWYHSFEEPIGTLAAAWSDKRYLRLYLEGPAPKHAIEAESDNGVWRQLRGTYCVRIEPAPYPYPPKNVISGISRPESGTNIWIADPNEAWPHWIELDFGELTTFDTVQLTFDSNLDRQMDEGAKCLSGAVPEILKKYTIQIEQDGDWQVLSKEMDNHQRWRRHTFQSVRSRKLRILCEASQADGMIVTKPELPIIGPQSTHLDMTRVIHTARIFEVRVYNERETGC